jgi:hypothetical protein
MTMTSEAARSAISLRMLARAACDSCRQHIATGFEIQHVAGRTGRLGGQGTGKARLDLLGRGLVAGVGSQAALDRRVGLIERHFALLVADDDGAACAIG